MEKRRILLSRGCIDSEIKIEENPNVLLCEEKGLGSYWCLRIPLPKGKWKVLEKNGCGAVIGRETLLPYFKIEWWARKGTPYFKYYNCDGSFKLITLFKWIHLRVMESEMDYNELDNAG